MQEDFLIFLIMVSTTVLWGMCLYWIRRCKKAEKALEAERGR
jgi:hypothetical protein